MLNQKSEEELQDVLLYYINDYNTNKNTNEIAKKLEGRISINRISNLFNQHLPIENLKKSEMYFLSKVLYEMGNIRKEANPNPKNYFTDNEIQEFENLSLILLDQKFSNDLIIENVEEVIPDKQWIVPKIMINQIIEHIYNSLVIYNFNTQRETEKKELFGKQIEKAKLYKKSIKEMTEKMHNGEYVPTAISYNILKNGFEKYEYDKENKRMKITVEGNSQNNLIDGMHRGQAGIKLREKYPEDDQIMQLNIFHFDVSEARNYIRQEGMKNEIKTEIKSYYDSSNIYNLIAQNIGEEGNKTNNFMYGNIGQDYETVEKFYKYCTYETLSSAIANSFKIDKKDAREKRLIKEYLIEYFNELLSILKDEFNKVKDSRTRNFATYNNIFYGYVALASKIYEQSKWQDKLSEAILNIDFAFSNEQFKTLNVNKNIIMKKQIKALEDYFKNLIEIEEVIINDGR